VKIKLHTGRTHQIRVQFASRGMPLVGDGKYGSRIKSENIGLWSHKIEINADVGANNATFESEPEGNKWFEIF
jgi:23S rRNA pseudouridine1911/1915/1917 synthase